MSNVSNKFFSHTHYGVSTVAAVLYGIVWLLGNQVHAANGAVTVLPAVVVTAQREAMSIATLDPVVVTGQRQAAQTRYAMLEPVVVLASRNVTATNSPTMQPAVFSAGLPVADVGVDSATHGKGLVAKVRGWIVSALLK